MARRIREEQHAREQRARAKVDAAVERGRKHMKEIMKPPVHEDVIDQKLERDARDANRKSISDLEEKRLRLLEPFQRDLPSDRGALIEETKFFLAQGAIAFIQVGRRLIVLKETTEHSEWYNTLAELDISPRTASNAMRVAHKFGNLDSMYHLTPTKLIALLDVSDEEIENIEKSGTVLGMSVDAIDAMSVRQLREKLRVERHKNAKGEEQLRQRDQQLREKDARIKELQIGPQTDIEFMVRCQDIQQGISIGIAQLRELMKHVKTESQRDALIGTVLNAEKQIMLIAHDTQAALDPTDDDACDAGRERLTQRPDGINWYDQTVFEFLKKATREANPDGARETTDHESHE